MATAKYVVTGMTCGHCVNHVKEEVAEIPGVTEVEVVLEGGQMTVTSDTPIAFDKIKEAVDEAGDYEVTEA